MPVSPPRHRPAGPERSLSFAIRRGSASKRGYDRTWEKLRRVILERDPLCVFCLPEGRLIASHQVDHIKPIDERPDLRLDPANLRGLCDTCHSKRTADYMHGNRY
jgi:5-methylcytosine-specific restriction enzyme A